MIVEGERELIVGAGRALPQRGLIALQPGRNNKESSGALSGPKKTLIGFMGLYALLGLLFTVLVYREISRGPHPSAVPEAVVLAD